MIHSARPTSIRPQCPSTGAQSGQKGSFAQLYSIMHRTVHTFKARLLKQYTQIDLVLAFINLYTQQSKSYFAGYQKYWIIRERQSICCCKNTVLGTKKLWNKNWEPERGMHAQEAFMTHRHETTRRKQRNYRHGQETPWGGSEKKLKALGLTKNALRERERSLVRPVRSSQKYILNITRCQALSLNPSADNRSS